jgi:hypothetical protein
VILKKNLTDDERKKLALKGSESAAFYAWLSAFFLPMGGLGGAKYEGSFGTKAGTWSDYTDALEPLTPSKSVIIDGVSRLVGLRIDDYLASDRFAGRLKEHPASVAALLVLLQGAYSLYKATDKPSADQIGTLTPDQWTSQFGLVSWLVGKVLKEQFKAPDFFDMGPLLLKTHPAFAAPYFGGPAPSGLLAEHTTGAGEGQGGEGYKFGATFNLPKLVLKLSDRKDLAAEDMDNLQKYRDLQFSVWLNYEKLEPTKLMAEAGKLPEEKLKAGTILGYGGHLIKLEFGERLDPTKSSVVTSMMLSGGYGYSGPKKSFLKKIGFNATYVDWKDIDILAPGRDTGNPTAGHATRITPFASLEFGTRHKFGVGGALSLVTGSDEKLGVSDARADISYTYMGDRSEDQLPVFKADVSGSFSRLDWTNPNSPHLWGAQARLLVNQFFAGGQVMTGAGGIPEARAGIIDKPEKVRVPTAVIFSAGYLF